MGGGEEGPGETHTKGQIVEGLLKPKLRQIQRAFMYFTFGLFYSRDMSCLNTCQQR